MLHTAHHWLWLSGAAAATRTGQPACWACSHLGYTRDSELE